MDILNVTIIGQDLFSVMADIFDEIGLNRVNQVNTGMLGNLKILIYKFELEENDVIAKRKALMNRVSKEYTRMTAMYVHGDWMRIFIMKPVRA